MDCPEAVIAHPAAIEEPKDFALFARGNPVRGRCEPHNLNEI